MKVWVAIGLQKDADLVLKEGGHPVPKILGIYKTAMLANDAYADFPTYWINIVEQEVITRGK